MAAFNFKSAFSALAADASVALNRAVQFTGEKLGTVERTELDENFDHLAEKADKTKKWTEKIISNTEAVLEPNPSNRVEDYFFEKIDKKGKIGLGVNERMRNLQYLGSDMISAGVDFGPETLYGSTLIKVGQTEQKLGETERDFVTTSFELFVGPLNQFMNQEMKAIMKERKVLEAKRLDLDAAKNRLKKAKTAESQQSAESDIRICQVEFERQVEVTRLLMEGLGPAHNQHVQYLSKFVEAQIAYYNRCQEIMSDLQKDLSSLPLGSSSNKPFYIKPVDVVPVPSPITSPSDDHQEIITVGNSTRKSSSAKDQKAKVVCDFDAKDPGEISVKSGEILLVSKLDSDPDWMMCQRLTRSLTPSYDASAVGKVPLAYLELLN